MTKQQVREAEAHPEGAPSLETLVARARDLAPIVRERALEAERRGRIHEDSYAKMAEAGFNKICAPKKFGGYELGLDAAIEVVWEIAQGCGSSGWIANLMTVHNFQAGMFPLEAQEEYFANGVPFNSTASRSVASEVTEEGGGLRVSGRWKYASGSDFADWFIIMRPSPQVTDWILVPRSDVTLMNDWEVAGLAATGSQDIVLTNVFVPPHRRLSAASVINGTTHGRQLHDDPFYRVPFFVPAAMGIVAAVIGMAEGMVEEFTRQTAQRYTIAGRKASEAGFNQAKVAEADVNVAVARLLLRDAAARVRRWGEESVPTDPNELLRPRRDYAFATRLMAKTAQELYSSAGAGGAFLANPIQRFARDIFVGSSHVGLNWDDAAEAAGRARLGA